MQYRLFWWLHNVCFCSHFVLWLSCFLTVTTCGHLFNLLVVLVWPIKLAPIDGGGERQMSKMRGNLECEKGWWWKCQLARWSLLMVLVMISIFWVNWVCSIYVFVALQVLIAACFRSNCRDNWNTGVFVVLPHQRRWSISIQTIFFTLTMYVSNTAIFSFHSFISV